MNGSLQFYRYENKRSTPAPAQLSSYALPFDILIVDVCSLSTADAAAVGLRSSILFRGNFDVIYLIALIRYLPVIVAPLHYVY